MPLNNPVASNIPTFRLLDDMLTILGSTKTTFWPFLESGSLAASEIVRSYGESVHIFTMTDPGSLGFMPYRHSGGVHSYHFDRTDSLNGAGEDHADFSFDDSGTNVCSFGAWVNRDNAGSEQAVLAKYDAAGGGDREWKFGGDGSNKLRFELYDENANAAEIATGGTNLALNKWQFLCITYDSAGGTSANAGLKLYLDAARETETLSDSGTYVAMQAGSTPVMLGAADDTASPTIEMDGRIALPFICGKELSEANVASLRGIGDTLLGLA